MRRFGVTAFCLLVGCSGTAFAQQAPIWNGFSAGVGVGGAFGNARSDLSGSIPTSSAFGAIFAGYDYQFPNRIVLGLSAGISPAPGLFGNLTRPCPVTLCGGLPATNDFKTEVDWFADIRPRLGYAIGRYLPYVTAGFGFGEGKSSVTTSFRGMTISEQIVHSNLRGAVFGAGVQYAATDHLTLGALYLRVEANANRVPGGAFSTNAFRLEAAYHF